MSVAAIVAARGAVFLDERRPGWADEIDVERLDLAECTACVLGQLFDAPEIEDPFLVGRDTLGLNYRRVLFLGFDRASADDTWQDTPPTRYDALNRAWAREIEARQANPTRRTTR